MNEDIKKISTEQESHYHDLEKMSVAEILTSINTEDKTVPLAIEKKLDDIRKLTEIVIEKVKNGGRLFYVGAGTSGRTAIADAAECPPTYGVPYDLVIALMAGGRDAIFQAAEKAEDNFEQGFIDLQSYNITDKDIVIGIAASGRTPYVVGALTRSQEAGIATGCVVCSVDSKVAHVSDYKVEVLVGPEFVTGSTRMKAGTAQKLILNMITTTLMISLGKVKGNRMTHMKLSNEKLVERGIQIVMSELNIERAKAAELLKKYNNSVSDVIENYKKTLIK